MRKPSEKLKTLQQERGFAVFLAIILVLVVALVIILGIGLTTLNNIRSVRNALYSIKSYYVAESGIEDLLLRLLDREMQIPSGDSYTLKVGDGLTAIIPGEIIGGSRTIISEGNVKERIRKVQISIIITTDQISFFFGAQVGEEGMEMGNNSEVQGNVFSNGNIIPAKGGDKGFIRGTVKVANEGNRIEGLIVDENAYTHTCKYCTIAGILWYVSSYENCDATGGKKQLPGQINPKDLPITLEQINKWKETAVSGGVIPTDYVLDGKVTDYLGPKKIEGTMVIDNGANLIVTGTIWVVGNIVIRNGAIIELDNGTYGSTSGVIIADGKIDIRPNVVIEGSGEKGSYVLLLSTNISLDKSSPAINVDNTTQGAIFYAFRGLIVIRNRVEAREVTGYKIFLDNNAIINYEVGLEDTAFSSGPGGGWQITGWEEVE